VTNAATWWQKLSADFPSLEEDKNFNYIRNQMNGTAHFKNASNYLNTSIYFYLETSGGS
jgi:hypothetical protein